MESTTQPGECDAVCAREGPARNNSGVTMAAMLVKNLRSTCENEMNTRVGLIVDTSSFKGIASADSLFNPGRWRTVHEQSSLFASHSAITPFGYHIRLSSLNTGLLAAALLERNCRRNLQS